MMASSVPVTDDSSPYADRRAYPRVSVALPAFLQANGERHSVQLLDLSSGGAKLDCSVPLAIGCVVVLDCGAVGGGAVVRWQNGGVVGLAFERELDPRVVSALAERSIALAARMKSRE
jgi:hypothetical protein